MAYVDGFVIPVPKDRLEEYKRLAALCAMVWKEHGALATVECVGEGLRPGEVTSFIRAVQARDDEAVVFSWIVYPDRAGRDATMEKVMADPRLQSAMQNPPFDTKRMIAGGFIPFQGL